MNVEDHHQYRITLPTAPGKALYRPVVEVDGEQVSVDYVREEREAVVQPVTYGASGLGKTSFVQGMRDTFHFGLRGGGEIVVEAQGELSIDADGCLLSFLGRTVSSPTGAWDRVIFGHDDIQEHAREPEPLPSFDELREVLGRG